MPRSTTRLLSLFGSALLAIACTSGRARAQGATSEPANVRNDPGANAPSLPATPWRLQSALDLPSWLQIRGEQRSRYEFLDAQFRRGFEGSDQGFYFRSSLWVSVQPGVPQATLELMDSRQARVDDGSPVSASDVNAVEPIQAFAALNFADVLAANDKLFVQGGRFTMDVGSRRLVARNSFRNAINTFTGVNSLWTAKSGATVQGFWTLPIDRLPADLESVLDNDVEWDDESIKTQFWGLAGTVPKAFASSINVQGYLFGLHEDDDHERDTRNRELYTIGGRIGPRPAAGLFDFEIEAAYQFGQSRASASSVTDLDHSAYLVHGEVGYTFAGSTKLRAALQFDYVSGDDDPSDGDSNRFDTLYGARRFDYGPTGILGAFPRGNLISPGYRLTFSPAQRWDVMFSYGS